MRSNWTQELLYLGTQMYQHQNSRTFKRRVTLSFDEDLPVRNTHIILTCFESQIHGLRSNYVQETLLNLSRPLGFCYTHEFLFSVSEFPCFCYPTNTFRYHDPAYSYYGYAMTKNGMYARATSRSICACAPRCYWTLLPSKTSYKRHIPFPVTQVSGPTFLEYSVN